MAPNSSPAALKKCNLVCKYCKVTPSCLALCPYKVYYVVSKDPVMSRACIQFGTHEHPMAKGNCHAAMDQIRDTVKAEVSKTPIAKASAIQIVVGRELLMKGLIDEDGNRKVLSKEELNLIFKKWSSLSTSSTNNLIHVAKVTFSRSGYVDNILKLKKGLLYDYIQDSCFPGQGSDLVYIFKMSTIGLGSGIDLVKKIQPRGDQAL